MKVGNWRLALGIALAGAYLGGCAQNAPDIDRTQPDKVEKKNFLNDDEWYYRQTMIDTDQVANAGGVSAFEGYEGNLSRIRWSITEDALIAWSTVEPAEGVYQGQTDETNRRIGVVAMFPIISHFDVERSYSSATGEQTNVISEAGFDRHWYDRKYMRVNWSRNLTPGLWNVGEVAGAFASSTRAVAQTDGYIDPDRTRFIDLEPDREGIEYLDTTTEYYYEPDLYACYTTYGYDSLFNCEGGPVRVRNSFLKRPEKDTYVALDYLDSQYVSDADDSTDRLYIARVVDLDLNMVFQVECDEYAKNYMRDNLGYQTEDYCRPATFDMFGRFGYFRTDRVSFDEGRGAGYEDQRLYYANRWNIWKTMLNDDGSIMDMKDRVPKPIIYYTNPEYPLDMWPGAEEVAAQWNGAFLNAAALAKGVSVDAIKSELVAEYGEGNDKMYEIRWNSCSAPMLQDWFDAGNGAAQGEDRDDVGALLADFQAKWGGATVEDSVWNAPHDARTQFCAKLEWASETRADGGFSWQRIGDLRYSFFNWVDEEVPWLGYGPSAADPLTGQIISGNANFAGAAIRTYGPYAADIVQYMNGELPQEDLIHGAQVSEYLQNKQKNAHVQHQSLSAEGKREFARRSGMNPSDVSPTNFDARPTIAELPRFIQRWGKDKVMADANRVSRANVDAKAADTRMADFYDDPNIRQMMMADPKFRTMVESKAISEFGPDFDEENLNQAFIDVSAPGLEYARNQRRSKLFMNQSIMLRDNLDYALESLVTYAGVADAFKGKSAEAISKHFIHNMFVGTQLHEVGHTVGLRHNFSASMDVMNYHDEYWDVQRAIADGKVSAEDRWSIQGDLAKEISGDENLEYLNEAEFRLASVMDYTGDLTGRFGGLGKYDQAAINFAYAEMVEEFKPNSELKAEFGGNAGLNNFYDTEIWLSDYSELPRIMAGAGGSGPAQDPAVQNRGIDVITKGRQWVPIKQAINEYRQGVKINGENWKNGEFASGSTEPWINRTVPYNFCTDDRVDSSLGCDVFDWGSNSREVVDHYFNSYRLFQPFRRYNRGKINRGYENVNGYASWVYRTLKSAERPFRYYSYYQWYDLGAYTDDLRDASIDAINFYAELMATPEPGRYCKFGADTGVSPYWWFSLDDVYVPADWDRYYGDCQNYVDIDKGAGQFYNYEFTDEYDYRIERVGSYVDKTYATFALFEISSNYIDSAFFTDFRATNVTYWTLFQDELLSFLRGVIVGDYKGFAGVYNKQTGNYEVPRLVDSKTFGLGLPSDQVGMDRIYTPVSFGHEFNMLVGAMLYNTTWQDRYTDFGQYVKLAVTNNESQPFAAGVETVQFVHPTTGQVYSAAKLDVDVATGAGAARHGGSIAVELVEWANDLSVRLVAAQQVLDAETPGTQAYSDARDVVVGRSQQLEDVVAKMDMVRYVYDALGANALR
jgi:hypothetical protein